MLKIKTNRKNISLADKHFEPWLNNEIIKSVPSTSDFLCRHTLMEFVRNSCLIPGIITEFGVFRGGSAYLICKASENYNKEIHLFDTFSGIPDVSEKDIYWKNGDFSNTSLKLVKNYLKKYENILTFHQGEFKDTLKEIEDKKICFAHIDSDTYNSVKVATEYVLPRLSQGGIIFYDDYGDLVSQGVKNYIEDKFKKEEIIYIPTKQAFYIKK